MTRLTRREALKLLGFAGLFPWKLLAAWVLVPPVLSVESVVGNAVTLRWTDAGDETTYVIYRGTAPDALTWISSVPANTLTYTDVVP